MWRLIDSVLRPPRPHHTHPVGGFQLRLATSVRAREITVNAPQREEFYNTTRNHGDAKGARHEEENPKKRRHLVEVDACAACFHDRHYD